MTWKFDWTKNVLINQIENQSYEKTLLNQTNFDQTVPENIRQQAFLALISLKTLSVLVVQDFFTTKTLSQLVSLCLRIYKSVLF